MNLTAACNFNCLCTETDMEPVCGNNGLTYFSPCHAGCADFSSRSNFTNCACEWCLTHYYNYLIHLLHTTNITRHLLTKERAKAMAKLFLIRNEIFLSANL